VTHGHEPPVTARLNKLKKKKREVDRSGKGANRKINMMKTAETKNKNVNRAHVLSFFPLSSQEERK
jgi:hypothetical protein